MENKVIEAVSLKVKYEVGTDDKGNPIIKGQSFGKVNLEAKGADLRTLADELSKIINFDLVYAGTEEEYQLVQA